MFGLRWKSGKVRRFVLMEVAGHKDLKTKGDQGLNSTESLFILSVHWGRFTLLDLVSHAYYRFCGLRFHLFIYLFMYLADLLKVKLKNKLRQAGFRGADCPLFISHIKNGLVLDPF